MQPREAGPSSDSSGHACLQEMSEMKHALLRSTITECRVRSCEAISFTYLEMILDEALMEAELVVVVCGHLVGVS